MFQGSRQPRNYPGSVILPSFGALKLVGRPFELFSKKEGVKFVGKGKDFDGQRAGAKIRV